MNNLPVSHQFARGWFLTREVNIVNFKLLAQLTYIDIFPLRTGFNITLHFVSQIRRTAQIVTCCGKCSCCVWYSSDAAVLYEKSSVGVPGEADENWWKHQISSTYSTANVHFPWGHLMKWEINTHLWILQWWWHTHTHTHYPPLPALKVGCYASILPSLDVWRSLADPNTWSWVRAPRSRA